ncbi:hypothetical protein D3C83_208200 [compost metagenome]
MTQGLAVTNATFPRSWPGAFTSAFCSEWMQPHAPASPLSQRFGKPLAFPL